MLTIAGLAVVAALSSPGRIDSQVLEQIVATVNGDIVTRRDLDERIRVVVAQQLGRAVTSAEVKDDPAIHAQAAGLATTILSDAIDELLLLQWARDHDLEASDDDVDRVIARMRTDNQIETDEAFEALLRSEGIPAASLKDSIRRQLAVEQVRQSVAGRVDVTDTEERNYYARHAAEFAAGPTISYQEILVTLPPPSAALKDDVAYDKGLVRFVAAEDRVARGEDFGAVARELSDAQSKAHDGEVGPVDPAAVAPAIRTALQALRPGAVSAPLRIDRGYLLLKLDDLQPAHGEGFEAWRTEIAERIRAEKQKAAFTTLLERLRHESVITCKDANFQAACSGIAGR
jgi:parvulin-like peptidyl-prolyl isomerase